MTSLIKASISSLIKSHNLSLWLRMITAPKKILFLYLWHNFILNWFLNSRPLSLCSSFRTKNWLNIFNKLITPLVQIWWCLGIQTHVFLREIFAKIYFNQNLTLLYSSIYLMPACILSSLFNIILVRCLSKFLQQLFDYIKHKTSKYTFPLLFLCYNTFPLIL